MVTVVVPKQMIQEVLSQGSADRIWGDDVFRPVGLQAHFLLITNPEGAQSAIFYFVDGSGTHIMPQDFRVVNPFWSSLDRELGRINYVKTQEVSFSLDDLVRHIASGSKMEIEF